MDRDAFVAPRRGRGLPRPSTACAFGRLDVRRQPRYIGRIGLLDEEQREPLLVDWGAGRGPAVLPGHPAVPEGVVRRRHLRTHGREVVGIDDEVLDLDAAAESEPARLDRRGRPAGRAHARAAPAGWATSSPPSRPSRTGSSAPTSAGVLVVQGGPGTGKTAVALHRAAYLLYTHRARLARRGVLVVGPNPTFLRYIEQVLPSLGETGVLLARSASCSPAWTARRHEPAATAAVKGDLRWPGCSRRRWPTASGCPEEDLRLSSTTRLDLVPAAADAPAAGPATPAAAAAGRRTSPADGGADPR